MISISFILLALIDVICFFVIPDYSDSHVNFFTTGGIILLICFCLFLIAFAIARYFISAALDIKLAGYDAKKDIYDQILYGLDSSSGYEYQRWQANTDAVKLNEWLEKKKLYYCHWWNWDISKTVKARLEHTQRIDLKF